FEHALGSQVAAANPEVAAKHLGQPAFGDAVAGREGQFGAFLEIDHEINGDARVTRPIGIGRLGAVADKITAHGVSPWRRGYQSPRRMSSSAYGETSGKTSAALGSPCLRSARAARRRAVAYKSGRPVSASRLRVAVN